VGAAAAAAVVEVMVAKDEEVAVVVVEAMVANDGEAAAVVVEAVVHDGEMAAVVAEVVVQVGEMAVVTVKNGQALEVTFSFHPRACCCCRATFTTGLPVISVPTSFVRSGLSSPWQIPFGPSSTNIPRDTMWGGRWWTTWWLIMPPG